ncbi:peroxynitrite isomerase Rv2717c-like [Bidens hawaiensis]|uniref:peroxynitrite isomerase Rv2717c-like n=1 Tax=Bidens hawaiensis TaxID=980011 RepID=UPI00404B4FD1
MHAESGYWRPKPDGTIEVVIAQSTGLVEIQKGTYDAQKKVVKLQSELVGNASKVKEITRVFTLVDKELSYVVEMATNITSLQPHLKVSLKKL